MRDESKSITDIIHDSKDWFVHFHVNAPNLPGPGMGDVKDESNIRTLREVMNDGFLSVEVFDDSVGPQHIAREHALSRRERGHSCPQLQHTLREHALSRRERGHSCPQLQHTLREHALSRRERGHSCPQLQHTLREQALSQRSDGTRLAPKSQPKGR